MTVASNDRKTPKDIVLYFLERVIAGMNGGDADMIRDAVSMFSDDSTFWLLGKLPFSGTLRGRQEILDKMYLPSLNRIAPGTMAWQLQSVIAEGDKVVVEWSSQRKTADGRSFDNCLIALFEVKDGRIISMREYMDTQRAK
jgi:ketosteroid isomerase-like protein